MTNEDFRKLLMTPRAPPSSAGPTSTFQKTKDEKPHHVDDKGDRRKKKKRYSISFSAHHRYRRFIIWRGRDRLKPV